MSHFIATHNADGKAVFSSKIPEERHTLNAPFGKMSILWVARKTPSSINTEADIEQYAEDRSGSFAGVCPPEGTAAGLISFAPGAPGWMHRSMSLDVFCVLEGELELHLGSGEVRKLKAGDTAVVRAAAHSWINVAPNGEWSKLVAFAQGVVELVEINGKELKADFAV